MDKEQDTPKKYKISLYETELIVLYSLLRRSQPHINRIEAQIEEIFKKNPEFQSWKEFLNIPQES